MRHAQMHFTTRMHEIELNYKLKLHFGNKYLVEKVFSLTSQYNKRILNYTWYYQELKNC